MFENLKIGGERVETLLCAQRVLKLGRKCFCCGKVVKRKERANAGRLVTVLCTCFGK